MAAMNLLLFALAPALVLHQADAVEAQKVQLEKLRVEVADQVQLQAFDLVDELVLQWRAKPVFALDTPVVLAEVSVPVGFGSGLTAMIENHLLTVLLANRETHLLPTHCPACTAMVVHSGAKGTVVSRGVDDPEVLSGAGLSSGAKHALFLDFEMEGSALVLRARLTALEPSLPIVAARTLTTTTSAAAMLRDGAHLKTAEEARAEYLDVLNGRGLFLVPARVGVQIFARPNDGTVQSAPLVWVQSGLEVALSRARGWTASLLAGVTYAPESFFGWSLHARFARLLGLASSLTLPDVYVFLGGGVFTLYGSGALIFRDRIPTAADLAGALIPGRQPSTTIGSFQVGVELRIKNRVSASFYLESAPYLDFAPAVGRVINLGVISFHSYGFEV
jgi:hypothetical protein